MSDSTDQPTAGAAPRSVIREPSHATVTVPPGTVVDSGRDRGDADDEALVVERVEEDADVRAGGGVDVAGEELAVDPVAGGATVDTPRPARLIATQTRDAVTATTTHHVTTAKRVIRRSGTDLILPVGAVS